MMAPDSKNSRKRVLPKDSKNPKDSSDANSKTSEPESPENAIELANNTFPDDHVTEYINGRLAALSNKAHPVTKAEVRRRLFGPERFNYSLVGCFMRRAKTPYNSLDIVAKLKHLGFVLPAGRRSGERRTAFSVLTEAEAAIMAKDFIHLIGSNFPAFGVLKRSLPKKSSKETFASLLHTRKVLSEICKVMEKLCLPADHVFPVMGQPCDEFVVPEDLKKDKKIVLRLNDFSMLTHGFGSPVILAVLRLLCDAISHQLCYMLTEKRVYKDVDLDV